MNKQFAILFLMFLLACEGKAPINPADSWIEQGKKQLGEGAWAPARSSFEKARELDPANSEAEYGIVLSELRHFWSILDLASQISSDILNAPAMPGSSSGFASAADGSLDTWLSQLVADLDVTITGLTERTDRLRKNADARIKLAHYPFQLKGITYMDFGGEWDQSDAYVLDALFVSLAAVARTLHSQELAVGITPIYADYISLGETVTPGVISAMLARNLEREPTWLTLSPATEVDAGGAARWREAGALWLRAAEDIQELAVSARAEHDSQNDDIFRIEPEKRKDFLLQQPATDKKPARFLWEGSTVSVKATLERIAANLKEEGAPRIRLSDDLLLLGIVALDALRQSLDMQDFTAAFGITLPEIIGDFLSLPSSSGEGFATGILGIAGDYVPSGMVELDAGAFYRHPVDLRRLVPFWQVTPSGNHDGFLLSYECPRFEVTGAMQATGSVQLAVFDSGRSTTPGAGNDTITIAFATYGAGPTDAESIVLTEAPTAEGWFDATILPVGAPVTLFDDTLQLAGNPVTSTGTFTDTLAAPQLTFQLRWVDGIRTDALPKVDDFLCGAATRDAAHFAEAVLDDASWLDIQKVRKGYPAVAPDGIFGKLPYIPFGSPSFNGLLYINPAPLTGLEPLDTWDPAANGFADAMRAGDARTLNVLIQGYGALLAD